MISNLQLELKDGRIHDRHTVYYKSFASEEVIKNCIDKYISSYSKYIKNRKVNTNYHLNFIELKGNNVGYGYIYFSDHSFYYMLTNRTPDGNKNGVFIKNPNYVNAEERSIITKERYSFYKENKDKINIKWSWVFEYDYDDEDNEINDNNPEIFIKEPYADLGKYKVDEYTLKCINSCIEFKKAKDPSDQSYSSLENVKIGDMLPIETTTISFKFDNYIDTISITGFPIYMKNEEVLNLYSMFFEEDIKKYIKKMTNKNYNNIYTIEVTFKLKQYAQLLNSICRTLNVNHKNEMFILKNKPIKNNM